MSCHFFNLQDTTTAVVKKKPKVFSKDWFKEVLQFPCISVEAENLMLGEDDDDDFEDEQTQENEPLKMDDIENKEEPILSDVLEDVDVKETVKEEEEEVYEPINVTEVEVKAEEEVQEPERSPTPDPLRAIGAQLLSQLQGYKEDFNKFSNVMEENKPEEMEIEEEYVSKKEAEVHSSLEDDKLVTEEEKRMVKNMSNGDAWNHVMGSLVMVKVIK